MVAVVSVKGLRKCQKLPFIPGKALWFEDAAYALELLDIKYEALSEHDIREGK